MKRLSLVLILLLGGILKADAQEGGYLGYFVDIGPGAQVYGMGTACVAYHPHAESIFWNPAALCFMKRTEVAMNFTPLWEGVYYTFLGYARAGLTKAFGISYTHLSAGQLTQRDRSGQAIGKFSDVYRVLLLSLGFRLHEDIAAGFTVKGFNQEFLEEQTYGYGFDFGCSFRLYEGLHGGFNLRNLATRWGYPAKKQWISPRIRYGFSWHLFENKLILSWDMESYRRAFPKVFYGVEYRIYKYLVLRTGYRDGQLAVGIECDMGDLRWNYAAIQHDLGSVRQFSLTHAFGKPPGFRRLELEPNRRKKL